MSAKFYTLLTDIGAAKLASAAALGVPLKITQMAVGDGGGVLPTPSAQQTALVAEKRRAALNMLYIDPQNSSQIIAEQVIPETEGGWWIREVGLFDDTGALIAVGNCPESYKPQLAEGSGRTQTVRMVLITSSTDNITLKIDPSVVLATRKYVDDKVLELRVYVDDLMAKHLAAADPHTQYATKESPTLTGTPKAPTAPAGTNTTQIASTAFVQDVVTALNNALALKAPLASPTLTGTPTAPTAAQTVNNTQVATTAFVKSAIAALVASSPAALDTLNELAAALGNDPNFATTMTNALAGKQQKDATLTNLSGKDVAGLLQYLGLTNFADKNSSNEQMFNGVVASKKGVSAASSDGRRRVNLFVSDTGYELIVYIDGEYNNSIKIPTKYGTMALLDDVSNSVQSAPPPIGIPFFWPVSAMPNTVVPEWSSNVFLKMNDATFSASTYPALARVWPGLKLTDCRGEFLRIWDDGRGVDGGRALLSAQSDAIRNITGNVGVYSDGLLTYASGAFSLGPSASNKNNPISGGGANAYATFDASKVVPTASENRPRNVAFNLLVRAK
ncbi:phage tail protein [Citrobacter portucalensis]|uniref:phage tail protein n=1 Tax=Citrobacter portucalensis TaxID=1639133 RepID=UPI00388E7A4A